MSKNMMPRSSSSRYGLLDWADNNLVLKCPSREDSLEFTERGGGEGPSTSRIRRSSVTGDNDDQTYQRQMQWYQWNPVKNKLLGLIFFLAVICALLTGVAITEKRIDFSSMSNALKLVSKISFEEVVVVETNCGRVIGTVNEGAFVFKGIPFALPPQGPLRWSRPIPISKDNQKCDKKSKIQATEFGSKCFQVNPFSKTFEGSEDCLYLNVWTPKLDESAELDVMVWIHGGFLQFGSGHDPGLRPSGQLARKMNTVFVSFNYRLLSLGFLALDQLSNSGPNSSFGNYGLWDQVVALNWVQENIKSFGGDPKKVTLFGSDGGAACILALSSNPDLSHLFRSSWLIGPATYFNVSFSDASRRNHAGFLKRSGCQTIQCLRSLAPTNVVKLFLGNDDPSFRINDQNDLPIQGIFPEQLIVLDGELVFDLPSAPATNHPILLGSASQAIDFWPGPTDLKEWTWSQYTKYVTTSLDSFNPKLSESVLGLYPPPSVKLNQVTKRSTSSGNSSGTIHKEVESEEKKEENFQKAKEEEEDPEAMYTRMVSDVRQTCPLNKISEKISNSNHNSLYRYIVTNRPSKMVRVYDYESRHSFHLWDAIAFFDQMEVFSSPSSSHHLHPSHRSTSSQERAFRNTVQEIVSTFVKGRLNKMWKPFPGEIALLDRKNISLVLSTYGEDRCSFWESQGLLDYAWVS